ncbi:hypothetical protein BY996DRAFT_6468432 [Phakopsora pachyrhizi]|nr:hypothetical protein BY996DRAFT_6468432 [Phakopsora pachyrhizi]
MNADFSKVSATNTAERFGHSKMNKNLHNYHKYNDSDQSQSGNYLLIPPNLNVHPAIYEWTQKMMDEKSKNKSFIQH